MLHIMALLTHKLGFKANTIQNIIWLIYEPAIVPIQQMFYYIFGRTIFKICLSEVPYNLNFTQTHTRTQRKKLFVAIRLHIIERVMAPLSFLTARGLSLKLQWFTLTNVTALFAPTPHFIHSSSSFLSLSLHFPPLQCKHTLLLSQEHSHYNVYNFFIIPPFTNYPVHMFPALDVINLSWNSLLSPSLRLAPRGKGWACRSAGLILGESQSNHRSASLVCGS